MKIDSPIYENVAHVSNLYLVNGKEKGALEPTHANPEELLQFDFNGVFNDAGQKDRHYGLTREVRGYQIGPKWRHTEVRNERQVSVVTARDLMQIAHDLDVEGAIAERGHEVIDFMARALAANVVLVQDTDAEQDLDDLLGPNTKILFGEPSEGTIVTISENHLPCSKPAGVLVRELGLDFGQTSERFKKAAKNSRGYMAEIWAAGVVTIGDSVSIQLPVDFKGPNRAFWSRPNDYQHP